MLSNRTQLWAGEVSDYLATQSFAAGVEVQSSGATVPIKLAMCDSGNADQSSSTITVTAVALTQVATGARETLESAGDSNPDNNFRFDSTLGTNGGCIFNLSTAGLTTGTYTLSFTVSSDPTLHTAQFEVN